MTNVIVPTRAAIRRNRALPVTTDWRARKGLSGFGGWTPFTKGVQNV